MRKKKLFLVALFLLLYLSQLTTLAESMNSISFNVEFIPNLIFSRYDVDICLDSVIIQTQKHGEDFNGTISTNPGTHRISFVKHDDKNIINTIDLSVSKNTSISCQISCYRNRIEVRNLVIKESEEINSTPAQNTEMVSNVEEPVTTPEINNTSTAENIERVSPVEEVIITPPLKAFWLLGYNYLSDISRTLSLHSKNGDEFVFIAHYLPAGRYRAENKGINPTQLSFYKDGIEQDHGDESLIPGGQKTIVLFAGEEATFEIADGEFLKLSDGSTNIYIEQLM